MDATERGREMRHMRCHPSETQKRPKKAKLKACAPPANTLRKGEGIQFGGEREPIFPLPRLTQPGKIRKKSHTEGEQWEKKKKERVRLRAFGSGGKR